MGVKKNKIDIHVEVEARAPGDFGFMRVSGNTRSEESEISECEAIADNIRRHVDDLPTYGNRGVSVVWTTEKVCEHCGYDWTEESNEYNGGCCAADENGNHEAEKQTA